MSDDTDDVIDITFDDEAPRDASGDGEVIDIEFPPSAATLSPATPRAASPTIAGSPSAEDDDAGEVPMTAAGECPRCGYALRPLEVECPRCAREGPPPPAIPAPGAAPLPAADVSQRQGRSRGCVVGGIIGGIVLLAVIVGIPVAIWMQPAQQAKREYRLGLQAQLRADFETARSHYLKALELDPDMGLAAFSIGTTYIGVGDPALVQGMQAIVERATYGETRELDEADNWFRKTLEIGNRLPSAKRLMDQRIRTPAHLRAFAHASLALTAYVRAAAALNADAFETAMAWMGVVQAEAHAALADDPSNSAAQQIIRSSQAMVPPLP